MIKQQKKLSDIEIANEKSDRIMSGVAIWTSFYRNNPHRFCKDYLNIDLKLFQKILIYMMNYSTNFMFIASRGLGKTFLSAIFCVVRCILYPGTQICICAKSRSQSINVLEKITTILMPNSANLRSEISECVINQANAYITFRNTSRIKVVTANEGGRSNRSNIIIVDEFRMVDLDIINKIIRRFNIAPRQPKYLNNPIYEHLAERNKELFLTSAFYKSHWSYDKLKAYCSALIDDNKKYFTCGLPYTLAIKENLLSGDAVSDEMTESDFNAIGFDIEMGCLWYGESEDSLFNYDDIEKVRKIQIPFYTKRFYESLNVKNIKYQPKKNGEIRIVSADIAVSTKKGNDATAIFIVQLLPIDNMQYIRNVIWCTTIDGGHTETQALLIRKLYDEFECDKICLDTLGVGWAVYDNLSRDLLDDETGQIYPALSCFNDEEMHKRCKNPNAPKVIFAVKANANFNSECALSLRDAIKRGKLRLLVSEIEAEEDFGKNKWYYQLEPYSKSQLLLPYIQTSLLIQEMINLQSEVKNGLTKVKERSGDRKDRYSALSYCNYLCNVLERSLQKPSQKSDYSSIISLNRKPDIYNSNKNKRWR